mmetsp:Transcript_29634/g.81105  ORF Transcript_29634/g.81105 Transcript_29634/m.81105 type:complete len:221 (+) Transcript_29634:302-964(+)
MHIRGLASVRRAHLHARLRRLERAQWNVFPSGLHLRHALQRQPQRVCVAARPWHPCTRGVRTAIPPGLQCLRAVHIPRTLDAGRPLDGGAEAPGYEVVIAEPCHVRHGRVHACGPRVGSRRSLRRWQCRGHCGTVEPRARAGACGHTCAFLAGAVAPSLRGYRRVLRRLGRRPRGVRACPGVHSRVATRRFRAVAWRSACFANERRVRLSGVGPHVAGRC